MKKHILSVVLASFMMSAPTVVNAEMNSQVASTEYTSEMSSLSFQQQIGQQMERYVAAFNANVKNVDAYLNPKQKKNSLKAKLVTIEPIDNEHVLAVISVSPKHSKETILLNYLFTAQEMVFNQINVIATYTVSTQLTSNTIPSKVQEFFDDINVTTEGFISESGDIYSLTKSNSPYVDGKNFTFNKVSFETQTSQSMEKISLSAQIESLYMKVDKYVDFSLYGVNLALQDRPMNEAIYSLIGRSILSVASLRFTDRETVTANINNFIYQTDGQYNDRGNVIVTGESQFTGNVVDMEHYAANNIAFFAHFTIDQIQPELYEKLMINSQNHELDSLELSSYAIQMLNEGLSLDVDDFRVTLNDSQMTGSLFFNVQPSSVKQIDNMKDAIMLLNNMNLKVNLSIPVDMILMAEPTMTREKLDQTIFEMLSGFSMMGLGELVSYDGQNLKTHFEVKNGNLFIDQKMVMPVLMLFMNFFA